MSAANQLPAALAATALTAADIVFNMRAADEEANLVADIYEYAAAGGPAPRNRRERRIVAKHLVRRDGKGFHR